MQVPFEDSLAKQMS